MERLSPLLPPSPSSVSQPGRRWRAGAGGLGTRHRGLGRAGSELQGVSMAEVGAGRKQCWHLVG